MLLVRFGASARTFRRCTEELHRNTAHGVRTEVANLTRRSDGGPNFTKFGARRTCSRPPCRRKSIRRRIVRTGFPVQINENKCSKFNRRYCL